ncbi:4-hydroxy-tetrahydrodipicolinate synthase [Acetitomaculum ruminis DSM 5522]|uniref:4-hydroxy-tetrahydrodipicolinate synthase n=1 Tax=Acetitomaculum ruminis DSM 5522 TaxID=1120918 RepID=A0A1I0Z5L3_9FIRM|nr:4-hydroxy-tetrahydrodipicolinate synthase [Acetitomaculum ruminis]SFB21029.1 4-hydroxy-tetrahydrodipicolinate synthase [Acetitomaculum ruminis DSM 5522]
MAIFKGAGVALVTPFKENGEVNYEKLEELIDFHVENQTDSIIIVGTTGEGSTLSEEEHIECIKVAICKTNKRIPVIAGTGSNCTKTAVYLSKEAQQAGADGLLVVTPYYNKATQNGLIAHYTTIAKSVDTPIIMYNVPSRTGCAIATSTAAKLFKDVDNIVGIKDAVGNLSQTAELMHLTNGELDLYSGNDDQIVPILSLGGIGVISVLSNVAPKYTHDIVFEYLNGNTSKAAKLQLDAIPLIKALFSEVNPIPVKAAMNILGHEVGDLRLPLTNMEEANQAVLAKAIKEFGACL